MAKHEKRGLTAREAIKHLTPPLTREDREQIDRVNSDFGLWSGGTTWVDAEYNEKYGEVFAGPQPLLDKLANGAWYARGYREPVEPSSKEERVQVKLWRVLNLDVEANTASGGGLKYVGLLFYEGHRDGTKISPRGPVRLGDLRTWMEKRVASLREAGERSSVRDDEKAARKRFKGHSISRDWITKLRDELPVPAEWSTPGRRKKAGNN